MHRALVPTRHAESATAAAGVRRISVHRDADAVDLVLSAAMPVALLIPPIVDVLNRNAPFSTDQLAVRYQLSFPDGVMVDPSKTLAHLGIRDGAVLLLTCSPNEPPAPRFDDPAEAVSASVGPLRRCWTRRSARLTGSLVATWLAGTSATVLARTMLDANDARRAASVGAATTIALLTLVAAALAYRIFGESSAGLTLGALATGFAALAGLLAVPGGPGAPNALFAAAAAATSAAVMCAIADHAMAFTALTVIAVMGAAAAFVGSATGIPLQAIGAVCAAMSLALIEASPWMSIVVARLSPQQQTTAGGHADRLNGRVIRAHRWLSALITAFSASATLGAVCAALLPCLTGVPRLPGLVFATVTSVVLLLRARVHRDVARSMALVVGGTATLGAALIAAVAAYPSYTPHVAAMAMLLGGAALYLSFTDDATVASPIGRRGFELLECLAFAVVVPLGFWLCGLYGAARGLNL